MAKTLEDIQKIISEMGIEMIDFKLTDIDGRWRHLSIPAERLSESTMQQGIGLTEAITGMRPSKIPTWSLFRSWIPQSLTAIAACRRSR